MNIPHGPSGEEFRGEWQAQERALEEERNGVNPVGSAGDVARYRLIARALRKPRLDPLPDDFAARVAARIERARVATEDLLEMWLQRVLFLLLVAGGAAAILGEGWLTNAYSQASTLAHSGTGAAWILVVAACLSLSLAIEHLRRKWPNSGNQSL
jgi:hypothetical protein